MFGWGHGRRFGVFMNFRFSTDRRRIAAPQHTADLCQNRTTAAFYRSRMMLCVVRRCPSMSILDPPIDLQHGLIIHPGSPPSASPAMAHSISRALLDSRLARRRRFDAMSLTRPRR